MQIKFPYYRADILSPGSKVPVGHVELYKFLSSIKKPTPRYQEIFKQIQKAAEEGDKKKKDTLKQKFLFSVTPSVYSTTGRKLKTIEYFNPLMAVEFDNIDFAKELKEYLFHKMKCIVAAVISPSARGCKFLVRIPKPIDLEEYKEYFFGIATYLEKVKGFDPANVNAVLPFFMTWDADILVRRWEETTEWNIRGTKIDSEFDFKVFEGTFDREVTEEDTKEILRRVEGAFKKIEKEQTAHRSIVSLASWIGGIAGAGYLSTEEAYDIIADKISESDYCQKGLEGYKRTAKEMIEKGFTSPLELKHKHERGMV